MNRVFRWLFILVLPLTSGSAMAEMPVADLGISGHAFSVEVARTHDTRSRGLMFRQSLGENDGMLFVFAEIVEQSMWMMNTAIPLSVAFIDEAGVILNIADMAPYTLTAHRSAGAAKYALEMNLGWFAARKIAAGARLTGLEKVLPAR